MRFTAVVEESERERTPRRPSRDYSPAERCWLGAVAVFGFVGVNGAFAYGLLFQPGALQAALANPVAAAFMIEALVLVGVLAYLFERWHVSTLGWPWFVLFSLVGSLAFSVPVALLWRGRPGDETAA